MFSNGFEIGSNGSYNVGQSDKIEIDPAPISGGDNRQGNIRFNRAPVPGGTMQWAYASFTSTVTTADLNVGDPTIKMLPAVQPEFQ